MASKTSIAGLEHTQGRLVVDQIKCIIRCKVSIIDFKRNAYEYESTLSLFYSPSGSSPSAVKSNWRFETTFPRYLHCNLNVLAFAIFLISQTFITLIKKGGGG